MRPNPQILRRLQRIDKHLSIEWVTPQNRWAVFHGLQLNHRLDEEIDQRSRMIQEEAARRGYLFDVTDCGVAAKEAVHASMLVCYVVNDDGSFRELDGRLIEKFQRMDYWRRNMGLKDWEQFLQAKAEGLRERLVRQKNDVWDTIRRDPVFARLVSDALWGTRTRSVIVPASFGKVRSHAAAVSGS